MSVSNEIWMDSGAMVSMIPEQEIFVGTFNGIVTSGADSVITLNATFTNHFELVSNLYVGCVLEIYDSSNNFVDKTVVVSNTGTTLTVASTLATTITDSATTHYGILKQFGSPVPGVKGSGGSTTYTAQVLSVQFKSDTKGDYNDVGIIFGVLDANGGTERDAGIFFTSDGSFADAAL